MLTATILASLQLLGAPVEAVVEAQISDQSRAVCSAVFETQGRSGRISLVRAEEWSLQIIDRNKDGQTATRPTFVAVDGVRGRFVRTHGDDTGVATFSSTADLSGQLAREGTGSLRYEFQSAPDPVLIEIKLSPSERTAWSDCIMTLASFDRYH